MELIVRAIISLSKTILSFSQHKFIEKLGLEDAASENHLMKSCSPKTYRLVMEVSRRERKDRMLRHDRHGGGEGTMGTPNPAHS